MGHRPYLNYCDVILFFVFFSAQQILYFHIMGVHKKYLLWHSPILDLEWHHLHCRWDNYSKIQLLDLNRTNKAS